MNDLVKAELSRAMRSGGFHKGQENDCLVHALRTYSEVCRRGSTDGSVVDLDLRLHEHHKMLSRNAFLGGGY